LHPPAVSAVQPVAHAEVAVNVHDAVSAAPTSPPRREPEATVDTGSVPTVISPVAAEAPTVDTGSVPTVVSPVAAEAPTVDTGSVPTVVSPVAEAPGV